MPGGFEDWEEELRGMQEELRRAVEESQLLQIARSQYGQEWLESLVKIHVNITNPADPSFRSTHVNGILPIPDNNMRDHRKIIFYDLTEEDPYRGRAMFTGMGIGKHYTGAQWEDRAIMLQGPGALPAKDAARELLERQGFEPGEIPRPLRARPRAEDWDERIAAFERELGPIRRQGTVQQVHNGTGFTDKPINAAKAVLYSLMPPGSLIKVPDSLWQSHVYASLLAGSALRGCRVLVISPALRSAPSSGGLQMARAHGLMGRLIALGRGLDDELRARDGLLEVGIYAPRQGVGDIAGRMEQALEVDERWVERLEDLGPEIVEVARNAGAIVDSLGYEPRYLLGEGEEGETAASPKLHLKANFFATRRLWAELVQRPEMGEILRLYIAYLVEQTVPEKIEEGRIPDVEAVPPEMRELAVRTLRALLEEMGPAEEHALYLTVGSTNMDYRSMVMNGEVQVTLGGMQALVGMIDFLLLTGLCEWPDTQEELDALLPPPGGFTRRIASFIKLGL
jgi:hypothetical protein